MRMNIKVPIAGSMSYTADLRAVFSYTRDTIKEPGLNVSEAPRASALGISGKAKRNSAEATRLRPLGYVAVASRHSSPCSRTGHPGEGE